MLLLSEIHPFTPEFYMPVSLNHGPFDMASVVASHLTSFSFTLLVVQVECLSGLGSLQRNMGQLTAASGFLAEAVSLAEQLGDPALKAGALCQLGTVLIASDVDKAVKHLQESVDLREEQVMGECTSTQASTAADLKH
jgi:hypothetical protein